MCLAFGAERLDDVAAKLESVLEMQPPQGLVDKVRKLGTLKSIADSMPKEVSEGSRQEVVLTGDDVDLDPLPIQRCWPLDPAPFITLPAVITKNRETGERNVGMYRVQQIDRRSTVMHWHMHHDGAPTFRSTATGACRSRSPSAASPSPPTPATAPLPAVDELLFAGFLNGHRHPAGASARRSTCEVPANAEIVIEGYVDPARNSSKAPSATTPASTRSPTGSRVFHVTAITHRKNPIYPTTIVGKPPMEDYFLGKATERVFLPAAEDADPRHRRLLPADQRRVPQLRVRQDPQGIPVPGPRVMHAIWGAGQMAFTKFIVVVDEHVNVHDEQVFFHLFANCDPKRDSDRPRPVDTSITRRPCVPAARSASTPPPSSPPRARANGRRDRDEHRGEGARRRPLGRIRSLTRRGESQSKAWGTVLRAQSGRTCAESATWACATRDGTLVTSHR